MKKSKFLKKSLAMLLALMLVVAMIPLSAAAATPELREVRMSTDGSNWGPPLEASGSTYTGSYDSNTSEIFLQLVVRTGNTVYYTDKETNAPVDEVAGDNGIVKINNLDVDTYTSDGKVVIDFTVADSSDTTVRKSYSVELTPVTASADTSIEKFEINRHFNGNTVPQVDTTKIGVDYISINVPYDAGNGTTYTVRNLKLADGATATVSSSGGSLPTQVTNNNDISKYVVKNGDKITVKSAAGNTQTYTLYINRLSGFEKFSTKEGLDAIMFPENGTGVDGAIAVLLPYGYSTGKKSITITPEFELDYPSAVAYAPNGDVMVSGKTSFTIDPADVTNGSQGGEADTTFETYMGTDAEKDWTGAKNVKNTTWDQFIRDKSAINGENYDLDIQYTDDTTRTYEVYFFETYYNDASVISGLTIGSETATIDQETKTIDITLPAGTDLASLKLDAGETKFEMTASNGAVISFPSLGVTLEEKVDSNNAAWANRTVTDIYTYDKAINATSPIQVKVVPEDTTDAKRPAQQETWYTLNITASDNYEEVNLTGIKLEGPNGEEVTGKPNANGEIVLEVPYYVYDKGELADWKLFYSKTAGSAIRYDDPDVASDGPDTALPVTGADVDTDAEYIPVPGSNEFGAPIYVGIVGDDWSANSKQYKIKIDRADPKTDTTLQSFKLTGEDDYKLVNEANTYLNLNTIDQDTGKITAYVPWSAYQEWTSAEFGAIAKTAEDANAKIYFRSDDGDYYIELNNTEAPNGESVATNVTKLDEDDVGTLTDDGTAIDNNFVLYNGAKVYVLSEQAWVTAAKNNYINDSNTNGNLISSANWGTLINSANGGYIKEYTLDIVRQVPKEGNDIGNVYLVDGTGWRDQLGIDVNELTLAGDISYSFTSELNENGDIVTKNGEPVSINPVFLAYDDTTRAWVLGKDQTIAANSNSDKTVSLNGNDVPTAGTNGNGVFEDIANYDFGTYDEYVEAGKPFLLISRKGDVYIYNYDAVNGFVKNDKLVANKLVVTNEDGEKAYSPFTFQLGVDPAKSEAAFTSFYFKGYENFRGQIDSDTHTITVTLPYGSEFTYLVPVYEVSEGSIVTVDDPELMGKPLYNGVTDVNFTTTRKFTVIAENETTEIEWTVRVVVSDRFSDVNPGDWFYDNVMDAAEKGYISGMGNGTFEPKTATTRAQFASMIAKAMGYDDTQPVDGTRFSDVAEDQWYTGAINFCYDNGIILGYDDTTFQPGKTISRQEAASILKNAFNLTGSTTELFPDDDQIADWAKDNVYNVKHSGLMKGDADTGNFRPTAMITRAEAASILMNAHRDGLID